MKSIIKHQNKLAHAKFEQFQLRELKLFFKLLSLLEENKNVYIYTAKEIKNFIGMGDQTYEKFENLIRKLQKKTIEIFVNATDSDIFSIFSVLKFKRSEKIVEVKYGEDFFPLVNNISENYCRYNLKYIEKMKSKYAILFYIRSKAEYFKRKFYISLDELLEYIGKTYTVSNIDKKILLPMIEEINELTDLDIKILKSYRPQKRGRSKLDGYTFEITKKKLVVSEEVKKAIKIAKKNIYISKANILNDETLEILLDEFSEEKLIEGLLYAYREINKQFSTLKYLKTVISRSDKTLMVNLEETMEEISLTTISEEAQEQIDSTSTLSPQYTEKEILIYTLKNENLSLDFFETMKRKNKVMYYNTLKVQLKKMQESQEV